MLISRQPLKTRHRGGEAYLQKLLDVRKLWQQGCWYGDCVQGRVGRVGPLFGVPLAGTASIELDPSIGTFLLVYHLPVYRLGVRLREEKR
jgi:hypothetical protein